MASLLDAGWRPPLDEEVADAAGRSRLYSAQFSPWLNGLSHGQRERALEHYKEKGAFPPDLGGWTTPTPVVAVSKHADGGSQIAPIRKKRRRR